MKVLEFNGKADHIHILFEGHPSFWKRGYCFSSTGGASLEVVKKYIAEKQESPS